MNYSKMKNADIVKVIDPYFNYALERVVEDYNISRRINLKVHGSMTSTLGYVEYHIKDKTKPATLKLSKHYIIAMLKGIEKHRNTYTNKLLSLITHELIHLIDHVVESETEKGSHCSEFIDIAKQFNHKYNYSIKIDFDQGELFYDSIIKEYYNDVYGWYEVGCLCNSRRLPGYHKVVKNTNHYYCGKCKSIFEKSKIEIGEVI